jgi:integral membrane protein (TIGR01906 family)
VVERASRTLANRRLSLHGNAESAITGAFIGAIFGAPVVIILALLPHLLGVAVTAQDWQLLEFVSLAVGCGLIGGFALWTGERDREEKQKERQRRGLHEPEPEQPADVLTDEPRCARAATALSAVIVAATPTILIGNTLWVLLNSWLIEVLYALPGVPGDLQDLRDRGKTQLAITGIRSIQPHGDGVELLRDARLPSGEPALEQREVRHMSGVRGVVAFFLTAWAIALGFAIAAGIGLRRLGNRGSVGRALLRGAQLTAAAMVLVGVIMLLHFDGFFGAFHGLFFEGDSWRFDSTFTLRRLYPDMFWWAATGVMLALVVLQAAALVVAVRRWGATIHRAATAPYRRG